MRPRRPRWRARFVLAVLAATLTGCGGDGEDDPTLTVSAASSLTAAFEAYAESFEGDVNYSFAGSDELVAQIRSGAPVDVFAAANTSLPDELHAEGLVEKPVEFALNELVLAVPAGSDVASIDDLTGGNLSLVIGAEGVPVGDYTREVLDGLPAGKREAILASVRSEESDVKGIVGKLVAGAADAGFVYETDVKAAARELTAIAIPQTLEPQVTYGVAVVEGSEHRALAREFVRGLRGADGTDALLDAGFGVP